VLELWLVDGALLTNSDPTLEVKSAELQAEINRLSEKLGVRSMRVGLRTSDGLNIYVADDGSYHFAFYERGQLGFDRSGTLDDLLYWYTEGVVSSQAAKWWGIAPNASNTNMTC
jgi:hypothetical protein